MRLQDDLAGMQVGAGRFGPGLLLLHKLEERLYSRSGVSCFGVFGVALIVTRHRVHFARGRVVKALTDAIQRLHKRVVAT